MYCFTHAFCEHVFNVPGVYRRYYCTSLILAKCLSSLHFTEFRIEFLKVWDWGICHTSSPGPLLSWGPLCFLRNANGHHHMKKITASFAIREMQTKTMPRAHFTLERMAIIKKSKNNKCQRGCGEKGTLLRCWWECKLVQPLSKSNSSKN